MDNQPIGIFDSGLGGLTVLRQIETLLPSEDIIYFGDTARVPYGNKSQATIVKFTTENILFLLRKKVKFVVIACNTSSALALSYVQTVFSIPIIGVIEAGVERALKLSKNKIIGVIGTKSTIESQSYQHSLKQKDKSVRVVAHSCPLFVPLVEEGILNGPIVKEAVRLYLSEYKNNGVDTLILGCTHYPLLKKVITSFLKSVVIVDSAKEVAYCAKKVLMERGLLSARKRKGRVEFYVSDETSTFLTQAELFLKRNIPKPKKAYV